MYHSRSINRVLRARQARTATAATPTAAATATTTVTAIWDPTSASRAESATAATEVTGTVTRAVQETMTATATTRTRRTTENANTRLSQTATLTTNAPNRTIIKRRVNRHRNQRRALANRHSRLQSRLPLHRPMYQAPARVACPTTANQEEVAMTTNPTGDLMCKKLNQIHIHYNNFWHRGAPRNT